MRFDAVAVAPMLRQIRLRVCTASTVRQVKSLLMLRSNETTWRTRKAVYEHTVAPYGAVRLAHMSGTCSLVHTPKYILAAYAATWTSSVLLGLHETMS